MKAKVYNRVRTDYIEVNMIHYLANGDFEKYEALRQLANDISAPIDIEKIETEAKRRQAEYAEFGKKAVYLGDKFN